MDYYYNKYVFYLKLQQRLPDMTGIRVQGRLVCV